MKKFLLLTCNILLSVCIKAQTTGDYQSAASGNWFFASTWLRYNGTSFVPAANAPSSSDGVITILSGHTVTNSNSITIDQTIVNAGGTLLQTLGVLTIADGSGDDIIVNGNFIFNGFGSSVINGAGTLKVNNTMEWQSGKLQSNLLIATGAVLNKTTANQSEISSSGLIDNNGSFNWNGGTFFFVNGTFNNNAGATFTATTDDAMFSNSSNNFVNSGTFKKTSGTGTTTVAVQGSNSGIIQVNSGTISVTTDFINTGNITGTSGNIFQVNSPNFQINTGTTITGQVTFHQAGGTTTINASSTATTSAGSNFLFNGAGSSVINGSGTLTINGTMEWQSGKLQSNLKISSTGVLSKTTAGQSEITNSGVLGNDGIFNWNAGNLFFINGTLNNNVSGTINATGDDAMFNNNTNNFVNAGTFKKTGGTGTTTIAVQGSNSGIIQVNSGTISITSDFINTGNITGTSGNIFQANSPNFQINTGTTITGQVTFHQAGGITTINASPTATTSATSNFLFNGAGSSVINGSGILTINGTMEWQSGKLQSNLKISSTGVLSKTTAGQSEISNSGLLSNDGTFNWNTGNLFFSNGTLNNNTTGTLTATGNDGMLSNNTNNFANAGTFIKTNSSGTTTIAIPVNNTGTIKGLGTLDLGSSFASNGIIAPGTSPGLLTINGAQPFSANSNLQIEMQDGTGPGTGHDQLIRAGNITLSGTLTVTETGIVPPATYTIINLTSGTVSGSFSTVILPPGYTLQVNTTNVKIIRGSVLPLLLTSFYAQKTNDNNIKLYWSTENEINTSTFILEKSADSRLFESIGIIQAKGMGSNNYNYINGILNNAPAYYYRLKIIDKNGSFIYSAVIKISNEAAAEINLYPNPAKDVIVVISHKKTDAIIINSVGKIMFKLTLVNGSQVINVSEFSTGTYFLKSGDEIIKFVKQ